MRVLVDVLVSLPAAATMSVSWAAAYSIASRSTSDRFDVPSLALMTRAPWSTASSIPSAEPLL